ncbi:hypothetical protein ElyMa_004067500 [Elysia marginata]|uniref:Uncharacterized protein n=1 Tax=Elysia marginata TaxID=1093978 RepID=A0AAV4G9N8_9GAST|nr:hypothetical protein ElyMa_004067500 [Elysia marginata]
MAFGTFELKLSSRVISVLFVGLVVAASVLPLLFVYQTHAGGRISTDQSPEVHYDADKDAQMPSYRSNEAQMFSLAGEIVRPTPNDTHSETKSFVAKLQEEKIPSFKHKPVEAGFRQSNNEHKNMESKRMDLGIVQELGVRNTRNFNHVWHFNDTNYLRTSQTGRDTKAAHPQENSTKNEIYHRIKRATGEFEAY